MRLRLRLNLGRRGPRVGGSLIPTLGTLIYHFDAQVASSITEEGTGASAWVDQSANGFVAIQGTDANRPTFTTDGGNPALLFNGTSDFLLADSLGLTIPQKTCFFVCRPLDRAATYYCNQTNSSGGSEVFANIFFTTSIRAIHAVSSGSSSRITIANTDTLLHAGISRHESITQGEFELDDGSSSNDATVGTLTASLDKINIGRNAVVPDSFFNGYIMEVGAYEERLDDTTKTQLMDELKSKWGL